MARKTKNIEKQKHREKNIEQEKVSSRIFNVVRGAWGYPPPLYNIY